MNHFPGQLPPTQTDVLSLITTDEEDTFWPFEITDPPEVEQMECSEHNDLSFENLVDFPTRNSGNGNRQSGSGIQVVSAKQVITIKVLLKNTRINDKER